MLKDRTSATGKFTDQDEAAFVEWLERELEKVASFRQIKGDELARRVEYCEAKMRNILKSHPDIAGLVASPMLGVTAEEKLLAELRADVNTITHEVSELSKFTRLNYTGFLKILKKHDRHTSYQLKPMFLVRLNSRPFFKESMEGLFVRLSRIFQSVREGGHGSLAIYEAGEQEHTKTKFVRSTRKYWVEYDKVDEVKSIILKKLPAVVVKSKGHDKEPHNPAISSVYLDNESFQMYSQRLERREGAEALRLRWYGDMDQTDVFVERKIHHNPGAGHGASVKTRFKIKENQLNDYLAGTLNMDKSIQKMKDSNEINEEDLEELEVLAAEIQSAVLERGLKPVLRTFYNRTAFQLPGDSRVRISLDTELTFIREDNWDGRSRSGNNWRRTDCGVSWPFDYLPKGDWESCPFAVLEVKIENTEGGLTPAWLDRLLQSNLIYREVTEFSKFVHGVSILLENKVASLPFWLPLMGALAVGDKVPKDFQGFESDQSESRDEISVVVDHGPSAASSSSSIQAGKRRASSVASSAIAATPTTEKTPLLSGHKQSSTSVVAALTKPARSYEDPNAIFLAHGPQKRSWFSRFSSSGPVVNSAVGMSSHDLPDKKIALPVRVEPKVYFANERTFLSWIHFCIVIGGLALGLLNFGDRVGQISGLVFTVVSMYFLVYSLYLYQWRTNMIRLRDGGPYDDRFGPTAIVVVIFAAVAVNFYL
ncbi:vacuolar transporter chaperone, partial [Blyttiomyces sp. JEL0837]